MLLFFSIPFFDIFLELESITLLSVLVCCSFLALVISFSIIPTLLSSDLWPVWPVTWSPVFPFFELFTLLSFAPLICLVPVYLCVTFFFLLLSSFLAVGCWLLAFQDTDGPLTTFNDPT